MSEHTYGKEASLRSGRMRIAGKLLIQIDIPAIRNGFLRPFLRALEWSLSCRGNNVPRGTPEHLLSLARVHSGSFDA
jgi:hypothetical protein